MFFFDVDDEQIAQIVEDTSLDMRATMNILQFAYSPIIMRPLFEMDLPEELLDVQLPIPEAAKRIGDARFLAELQFELYNGGLLKSTGTSFIDGLGYVDEQNGETYSALGEVYVDMYKSLTSDFEDDVHSSAYNPMDKKWW